MVDRQEKIQFFSAEREVMHSHREIELLYVLTGKVNINIQGTVYHALEKDILIVNSESLHGWEIEEEALLCRIQIDYFRLKKSNAGNEFWLECNTTEHPDKDYRKIRYILECIVMNSADVANSFVVSSLYYTLWECVKNQLIVDRPAECTAVKNERIDEVVWDIRNNYGSTISLQSLSEKWFISQSALSRMIKKATGMKFVDLLRKVRLEHAREELLFSEKSITDISYECGFSNASVFHKNFKAYYKMSPSTYRTAELISKERVEDSLSRIFGAYDRAIYQTYGGELGF